MLFTKYINKSDTIMTEEEISEGLLESDFNLALINYDTNRIKYNAEMQAIEVYKQNNCNLELCTESFEIIKEGMMDKAKNIGKRVWEALKKIVEMLKNALKNFRAKFSKVKPKQVTPKKEESPNEKKVEYVWAGFILEGGKYSNKVDSVLSWVDKINVELKKLIRNGKENEHTGGVAKAIADAGRGSWLYKILIDYLNMNNAPFGKITEHDNENDFIEMVNDYLRIPTSGFNVFRGKSIEEVQKQIDTEFNRNKRDLEASLAMLESTVKFLDVMVTSAKDVFVNSDNTQWNTVAKDYGRLCRHSVEMNKRIILTCISHINQCINSMIKSKEESSSEIKEE